MMHTVVLAMFLLGFVVGDDGPKDDPTRKEAQLLVDTIESLQQPLEDFRCEFEGTIRYNRTAFELRKLEFRDDGLYESYNGVFIWRRGGDIYADVFRRRVPYNTTWRETLVVRMSERKAEQYIRPNDATIGGGHVGDPGQIFFGGMRTFTLYFFRSLT